MSKKILIIDDDVDLVAAVEARLEAANYEVCTATDGSEGINKACLEKPDLILLDVRMPRIDGWTFMHNLRQLPSMKNVPVIVTSAEGKLSDIFRLEGVSDFIAKPFMAETLLETIGKHLK